MKNHTLAAIWNVGVKTLSQITQSLLDSHSIYSDLTTMYEDQFDMLIDVIPLGIMDYQWTKDKK